MSSTFDNEELTLLLLFKNYFIIITKEYIGSSLYKKAKNTSKITKYKKKT